MARPKYRYPNSRCCRKADHDPKGAGNCHVTGISVTACEVKIIRDDDQEVEKRRSRRDLRCARPQVMAEYGSARKQTRNTLKSGWLHTGDIARADHAATVHSSDRKKDMIVSGGG